MNIGTSPKKVADQKRRTGPRMTLAQETQTHKAIAVLEGLRRRGFKYVIEQNGEIRGSNKPLRSQMGVTIEARLRLLQGR